MSLDLRRKKFLVIDDYLNFRQLMKRMLQSLGTTDIDEAYNGEAAIDKIRKKPYDIILCDYNLGHGKKDGQQILEECKHYELIGYSTIFIMLTAENTMPMVMGAVEYQPDAYLIKPITKEILMLRLEALIDRKTALHEIENAIRRQEYMHAIELCSAGAGQDRKNMLEYLRIKSDLFIRLGQYDDAITTLEGALSMHDMPWANMALGKVFFLTGSFLKAREIFQKIIRENNNYMEAYDWLAKTMEELDSPAEARDILLDAIEISPKAILRHRQIGHIASGINDIATAEKAYKSAIEIGKHSCFKSPAEYTGLAKTLVNNKAPKEALAIVRKARNEFDGDNGALLQTTVAESLIQNELGRPREAEKAIMESARLLESDPGSIPIETSMDLAEICFKTGKKDIAMNCLSRIIKNNYDDNKIMKMTRDVFERAEMSEEGDTFIASVRAEIIGINNKGVKLVKEGRLEVAIDYFEKAAGGLPENKIINANAARALLMHIQKFGRNEQFLYKASQYLGKVRNIDPAYKAYQELIHDLEKLRTGKCEPAACN